MQTYFTDTLEYSLSEYNQLRSAINEQHESNASAPDFSHLQASLAARMAYTLNEDGWVVGILTLVVDEDISYLAGWLGDATITETDTGTTILKNDDYTADLDAENIFKKINSGMTSVQAINSYYGELSPSRTRATIFLEHIPYPTVQSKVFEYLGIDTQLPWIILRNNNSDTYNFLLSL